MKNKSNMIFIFIFIAIINITPIVFADTYENIIADKSVTKMNKGDEIFFDNSATNWENVYIYIWQQDGNIYKDWNSADTMTKIDGTNIYKYTVPNEDTFDTNNFNQLIFKNGYDGNSNQTIALGYIESGLAYIANTAIDYDWDINGEWIRDRKKGHWYLYDKSSIVEHLNSSTQYQQAKEKYTNESYLNLDDLLTQAATELENEIVLYAYKDDYGNDINLYYLTISATLKAIDNITTNLQLFKGRIDIQTDGNGNVTTDQADNSNVEIDTEVKLSILPNENYELNELSVKDQNNNPVALSNNNTFIMPKSNIIINASFKHITKTISINITGNGTTNLNVENLNNVNVGQEVIITNTPGENWILQEMKVTDEENNIINITDNKFIMPKKNINISTIFKNTNEPNNVQNNDSTINPTSNSETEPQPSQTNNNTNTNKTNNVENNVNDNNNGQNIDSNQKETDKNITSTTNKITPKTGDKISFIIFSLIISSILLIVLFIKKKKLK